MKIVDVWHALGLNLLCLLVRAGRPLFGRETHPGAFNQTTKCWFGIARNGLCRCATRLTPSRASTFCPDRDGKDQMNSQIHLRKLEFTLTAGPAALRRLRWFKRRHWKGVVVTEEHVAEWIFAIGLLNIRHTSRQLSAFIDWREAEGFRADDTYDLVKRRLSAKIV